MDYLTALAYCVSGNEDYLPPARLSPDEIARLPELPAWLGDPTEVERRRRAELYA